MKIIAYRKHPNGPDYFTEGWKNVKEFRAEDEGWSPVTRLINKEIGPWAAEDIVRCEVFFTDTADKPDHILWLDITAAIWKSPPVTTLAHYVTNVERALRFLESELSFHLANPAHLSANHEEGRKRAKRARRHLSKSEGRLHDFILSTSVRAVEDRAWAKAREGVNVKTT